MTTSVFARPATNYHVRVLPVDEWPTKLVGTPLEALWPTIPVEGAVIVVVEREDRVIGCCLLAYVLHAEGLWIAEAHRGRAAVGRRLWQGVNAQAREMQAAFVVAGAITDQMRDILQGLQATWLPTDQFAIPVKECM